MATIPVGTANDTSPPELMLLLVSWRRHLAATDEPLDPRDLLRGGYAAGGYAGLSATALRTISTIGWTDPTDCSATSRADGYGGYPRSGQRSLGSATTRRHRRAR
jgi:uncharacterized membrane-anchored protein